MKSRVGDILLLIVISIIIFLSLFGVYRFAHNLVSEQWVNFIMMSLFYLAALIHSVFVFVPFRRYKKINLMAFQLIYFILTTGSAVVALKLGLVALPDSTRQYFLPMVALGLLSIAILHKLTTKYNIF